MHEARALLLTCGKAATDYGEKMFAPGNTSEIASFRSLGAGTELAWLSKALK